jgi:dihydropteroate synthase
MSVVIAGVLNLTPDSFSDGGRYQTVEDAVATGVSMVESGAHWIDVGGESTRPGATVVPEPEEIRRVVPVIERLAKETAGRARISIDTYKSGTAQAALAAGATVVNDISGGLLDSAILSEAAQAGAGIVLGHLRGTPSTMMDRVCFEDVVGDVARELAQRVAAARAAGCQEIWVDPGIGFGKAIEHNLSLLASLPELRGRLDVPVMVGVSRKRFLGELTGRPIGEREFGTAAAVATAVLLGADAVRVHDVKAMRDVVRVAEAVATARQGRERH